MEDDPRLDYPATHRNREAILGVLRQVLPADGLVLEIGSGSGQHVAYFADLLANLRWQPTDYDESVFASIRAWSAEVDNVDPPLKLDTTSENWPIERCDAVFCANMIHVAPWEACLGLLDGVAARLRRWGPLVLYGPFTRGGTHTAPSNESFDRELREKNPDWGVRDLVVIQKEAKARGLDLDTVFDMPANNLIAVFRK